jgi:hypothetical protein
VGEGFKESYNKLASQVGMGVVNEKTRSMKVESKLLTGLPLVIPGMVPCKPSNQPFRFFYL